MDGAVGGIDLCLCDGDADWRREVDGEAARVHESKTVKDAGWLTRRFWRGVSIGMYISDDVAEAGRESGVEM